MSSFPNLPQSPASGAPGPPGPSGPSGSLGPAAPAPAAPAGPSGPDPGHTGLHTISAGPAVAEKQFHDVAQMPLTHVTDDEAVFMSEQEFMDEYLKESYTIPIAALGISTAIALLIYGARGMAAGGIGSAIGGCIAVIIAMAIGALCASAAGWIVAKLFGDDYGSAGVLILRFSAVSAAAIPIFEGLGLALGFFPAIIFSYPVMLVVTIFVAGIDFVRAIVFNVILTVVYLVIFSLFIMSIAAS